MMSLKTVTLLAAVTQLLSVCCGIYTFIHMAQGLKWEYNAEWFVTQPIYLVAHIMLVVFLFTLFARQQSD
jgi:uncharacterized membrane protein YgdD (TMEM256/DUF423 family)